MELIVSLIMVPCVAALLMLVVRVDKARDVLCVASAAVIALLSIAFAVQNLGAGSLYFDLPMEYSHFLAVVNIVIDITVGLYIVCYSVKYRRVLPRCGLNTIFSARCSSKAKCVSIRSASLWCSSWASLARAFACTRLAT